MKEFESTNVELSAFVVSVYLLGFSFGPLLIAPLSELYGRAPCYHVCNVMFIVFNVACAVANSLDSLIVFRFLAGSFGSAPLTIGAGSMADMISQENRGAAMSAWALGPLLGPVVGPIAGAYLTEAVGWRWTFWVLAIAVSRRFTGNTRIGFPQCSNEANSFISRLLVRGCDHQLFHISDRVIPSHSIKK